MYADTNLESVESEVLRVIEDAEEPYSLMGLIQYLKGRGVRDSVVRAALWHLIDRADVELGNNWKLRSVR